MSSYILEKESFIKMAEVTVDLIIKYGGILIGNNFESVKRYDTVQVERIVKYVKKEIYYLADTNIKSVNQQYDERAISIENLKTLDSIKNFEYNDRLKDFNYSNQYLVLFNLYKCLDYQIEMDYNKDFINKINKTILNVLSEIESDRSTKNFNTWDYVEYLA